MQAIEPFRNALALLERYIETEKTAKQMAGVVKTSLADILVSMGSLDDAEKQYESALIIAREIDDQRHSPLC